MDLESIKKVEETKSVEILNLFLPVITLVTADAPTMLFTVLRFETGVEHRNRFSHFAWTQANLLLICLGIYPSMMICF